VSGTTSRTGAGRERGQTIQDYAIGISVFVLTVTAAVTLFPSLVSTYGGGPSEEFTATVDRVSESIVRNQSASGRTAELDPAGLAELDALNTSELRERFALRETTQVNVTLRTSDGSAFVTDGGGNPVTAGEPYRRGREGAQEIRIVTLSNDTYAGCAQGCRLVVRVW
jgi:hypothetical protein